MPILIRTQRWIVCCTRFAIDVTQLQAVEFEGIGRGYYTDRWNLETIDRRDAVTVGWVTDSRQAQGR
jgi:hypothetical protein